MAQAEAIRECVEEVESIEMPRVFLYLVFQIFMALIRILKKSLQPCLMVLYTSLLGGDLVYFRLIFWYYYYYDILSLQMKLSKKLWTHLRPLGQKKKKERQ